MKYCESLYCSKPFVPRKSTSRFCSKECKSHASRKPKKLCKRCSTPLENRSSIFCSQECNSEYRYESYIQAWLEGSESGGRADGCSNQVRRWVRERYGLFCWECGWAKPHPVTGEPPLQIDHIDGDASHNRPENLRLLCGGCHSLTPTFGNRGGRKSSRTYRYDKQEK